MISPRASASQRGVATIFIAMVLLILITLMVVTAFSLSTMNLKAVGNVQTRNEAIAAADKSLELAISQTFWNPPIARDYEIDIDRDSIADYQVNVSVPTCLRASEANISTASSVTLPGFSAVSAWNTIWELEAVATNEALGTRVRVRHGVRVLMNEADKELYCGT
jgi:hypothetical protein